MKKIVAVVAFAAVSAAVAAHAEHKLLITDVLDAGQFDGTIGYEYTHTWGAVRSNVSEMGFGVRAGLGHGLQIGASVPYVIHEGAATAEESEKRDGFGDFTFGAKYNVHKEPVDVAVGLDVKFDTARGRNAGTGTTDFTPYVAVSKELGHETKPYVAYLPTLSNNHGQDAHVLRIGVEKELNEMATIDAKFDFGVHPEQSGWQRYESYNVELGAYLQVAHNLYLLPAVSMEHDSFRDASVTGVKTGIALYTLF